MLKKILIMTGFVTTYVVGGYAERGWMDWAGLLAISPLLIAAAYAWVVFNKEKGGRMGEDE